MNFSNPRFSAMCFLISGSYFELISKIPKPMPFLLLTLHALRVVPLPKKGSNTVPPCGHESMVSFFYFRPFKCSIYGWEFLIHSHIDKNVFLFQGFEYLPVLVRTGFKVFEKLATVLAGQFRLCS
jgi:hypothetical protein